MPDDPNAPPYLPSLEEIKAACVEIRKSWSGKRKEGRQRGSQPGEIQEFSLRETMGDHRD